MEVDIMGKSLIDIVVELMDQGLSKEAACREAYYELHPERYDTDDYDN